MKDIKTQINDVLSKAGVLDKIKELSAKFNAIPAPIVAAAEPVVVPEPAKAEIKTVDGMVITVDGEIKEGAKVMIVTPDGMSEVADGDYTAEDKTVYSVAGGAITKITPSVVEVEPAKEDMPAMMKALTARLEAIESKYVKENADLTAKLSAQNDELKVAFTALNAIANLPASEPIEKGAIDFSSIADPLERRRAIKASMK
jgi:hypothetical protein